MVRDKSQPIKSTFVGHGVGVPTDNRLAMSVTNDTCPYSSGLANLFQEPYSATKDVILDRAMQDVLSTSSGYVMGEVVVSEQKKHLMTPAIKDVSSSSQQVRVVAMLNLRSSDGKPWKYARRELAHNKGDDERSLSLGRTSLYPDTLGVEVADCEAHDEDEVDLHFDSEDEHILNGCFGKGCAENEPKARGLEDEEKFHLESKRKAQEENVTEMKRSISLPHDQGAVFRV